MNDDTGPEVPSGPDRPDRPDSTATATSSHPAQDDADGPRVSAEEARDVSRLRRSRTDRKLLGVCGGLARQLDVDPTLVRVVAAVLVLFGGAGLLVYLGAWLLVPDEGTGRAVVHLEGGARSLALVLVGGVGALVAVSSLGRGAGGLLGAWWLPVPVLVLLVVGAVVVLAVRGSTKTPAAAAPPSAQGVAAYAQPHVSASGAPPGSTRRLVPAYVPPTRPRRTGPLLFWPTLAVVAIALGALGVYDASGGAVADGAYAALALAVTGIGLVVGAFRGRPGGLVLLGLVCAVATAGGVVVGSLPQGSQLDASPATATQLRPAYRIANGDLLLDLTEVTDVQALDGKRIRLDARSGIVRVVLPDGVAARVDARIDLAGAIDVAGTAEQGGFAPHLTTDVEAAPGAPVVDLDISSRLGAISVRHQ